MRIASGPDRGAHLVAGLCSLHYVSCRNAGLPEWLRSGPLLAMDAHACSMIAVWVQLAALSAVFRTQTAIMGGTAEGAGRIRSARGCLRPAMVPRSPKVIRQAG